MAQRRVSRRLALVAVGLGIACLAGCGLLDRGPTPEQVRAVARKYLTDDRLTVATLEPLPLDDRRSSAPSAGTDHPIR